MISPLKKARLSREQTLQFVADAVGIDTGNLSRIERGIQVPSKDLTEKLAQYFDGEDGEIDKRERADLTDVGQHIHRTVEELLTLTFQIYCRPTSGQ
jgi:transcriptional regulator with XRE-family HTH domain